MRFALIAALAACASSLLACGSSTGGSTGGTTALTGRSSSSGGSGTSSSSGSSTTSGASSGASSSSRTSSSEASSAASSASSTVASSSSSSSSSTAASSSSSSGSSSVSGSSSSSSSSSTSSSSSSGSSGAGTCPSGYTAGTANGIAVCKSSSGIPLFSHVWVIMMENTSASGLSPSLTPYLEGPNGIASTWATSSNYSGVTDPSLPNYIAITSGGTQTITCDCQPIGTACQANCSNLFGTSGCNCGDMTAAHLGDQLDTAKLPWREYGQTMGTACNTSDNGAYATKHIPFLYYNDVLNSSTSGYCANHVVDYGDFAADLAATPYIFNFISPDLNNDMHGTGTFQTSTDITAGDTWLSNNVPAILSSPAFTDGGIVFLVWDEGGFSLSFNNLPFFLLSPLAKKGGYTSGVAYTHYGLLATIEDGLNLGSHLGSASGAAPLADFFPAN